LKHYLERRGGNGSDVLASRRFGVGPEGFLSGGFQEIVPFIGEASPYEVRHRFMKGRFNQSLILGKQRVFIDLLNPIAPKYGTKVGSLHPDILIWLGRESKRLK
jgi:hypothetical protein